MRVNGRGVALAALVALMIAACGGGSGSGDGNPGGGGGGDPSDPSGGINGGGRWLAVGSLSNFGSIIVNGVRYDTAGSAIVVNGQPATQADLAQGQVVSVEGDVDVGGVTGQAERVLYEHDVRGVIQQINQSTGSLNVLGQAVQVSIETIFGSSIARGSLESLAQGDAVVISGFRDSTGRLDATRIDRDAAPGTAELRGQVSSVDTAARNFRINGLTVDYAAATLEGLAAGQPANGDNVFVRGPSPAAGQPLAASLVAARAAGVGAVTEDNVDLEGLVTRFATASDFDVAGQRVAVTPATEFVGASAAELAADVLVDVEGQVDANDQLQADRIEVIPRAGIKIEARIDGVDVDAGTISLLGILVDTTPRTRFEDDDGRPLTLDSLRAGDEVEIAGYLREGRLTAVRVERDDDDDNDSEVDIEGPVSELSPPEFRIGGIRVLTDSRTEFEDDDRGLSAAEFFAIAEGRVVEVEGTWTGEVVLAEEVEFED
jgi:hypothetical protein